MPSFDIVSEIRLKLCRFKEIQLQGYFDGVPLNPSNIFFSQLGQQNL